METNPKNVKRRIGGASGYGGVTLWCYQLPCSSLNFNPKLGNKSFCFLLGPKTLRREMGPEKDPIFKDNKSSTSISVLLAKPQL